MKLVLVGATGFIGTEVLTQSLANASIDSVVVLSRRPLPSAIDDPKLKVLILEDYTKYPDDVLRQLEGVGGCIWCVGSPPSSKVDDETKRINIDFPMAAAKALVTSVAPQSGQGQKSHFVHTSGGLAERNQKASLWFMGVYRKIRGEAENQLTSYAKDHSDALELSIIRPGLIVKAKGPMPQTVVDYAPLPMIKVDVVAACLIDLALKGGNHVLENPDIIKRGHAALGRA